MAKKISIDGLDHYKSKENAMIASAYDATKTYAVGDYAYNKGTLYKCTTPITTAEAWTAGHWTAAKLADDLTAQSEANGDETGYLKAQNYDDRIANNSDFVDGMWGASLRTDGAYGLLRSMAFYIPVQDINGEIFGTLPQNVVMAVSCYDENGAFLNYSKLTEAINTNKFTFAGDYLKGNVTGTVYFRLIFSIYANGSYSRLNNVINIYPKQSENVSAKTGILYTQFETNVEEVGNAQILKFSSLNLVAKGKYIKADGTLDSAGAHSVVSFKINKGKFKLLFNIPQNAGAEFGVVKNSGGTVVSVLSRPSIPYFGETCRIVDLADSEYTVYLNWFNANTTNDYYDTVLLEPYKPIDTNGMYGHMARKQFDFDGKTALFVGDSITRGYTSGSTLSDSIYPSLFCSKVGMTYTNLAVAGSGYTIADSAYQIITQLTDAVENQQNTTDYVFVAAGINDVLNIADMSAFKTAVADVVDYLLENFEGEIIFITPIKTARHLFDNYGFEVSIGDYCNAITEVVSENNINMRMSIVQGWGFGFPDFEGNSTMKTAMFGDDVHPSELGYKALYVSGLLNALC